MSSGNLDFPRDLKVNVLWKSGKIKELQTINTKLKPSKHSSYIVAAKQILHFKVFHFSRWNWGSSYIFLCTSMTKNAVQPTCGLKTVDEGFPKEKSKVVWQQNKASLSGFRTPTQCILTAGAAPPLRRQSCAHVSLAQTYINPIASSLLFLYLTRKSPKANKLKGSVSGYLATGKTHSSVTRRNMFGQSCSPSAISNHTIKQQWKGFKSTARTGIL